MMVWSSSLQKANVLGAGLLVGGPKGLVEQGQGAAGPEQGAHRRQLQQKRSP